MGLRVVWANLEPLLLNGLAKSLVWLHDWDRGSQLPLGAGLRIG